MADEGAATNRVRSITSGTPGRVLCSARGQHWVVDEPASAGGPGEAVGPVEAFFSGISACAVGMVERLAIESEVPLQWAEVSIEELRHREARPARDNLTVLDEVRLRFDLTGPSQEQGQELVEAYKRR